MKHPNRLRMALLSTILLGVALLMGASPLLARAENVEGPVELVNESRTIDNAIAVSNHTYALKATGSGEGGTASVQANGDLTNTTVNEGQRTYGLIAYGLDGGGVTARVGGNITTAPSAIAQKADEICGVFTMASSGSSSIEVAGNVDVTGRGDATGVKMNGSGASAASLKVGQNLTVTSQSEEGDEYDAFCAEIQAMNGSEVALEVTGDVRAEGGASSNASTCGLLVTSGAYDGSPLASCTATVHGSIEATGAGIAAGAKLSAQEGSRATLVVNGDSCGTCSALGTGVWVESTNGGVAEVLVRGVIRGTTEGIRFDGDDAANFDITTWKIETSEGGSLFQKGDYATCEPQDVATRTNYIVRLEQPQEGGTIAAVTQQKEPLARSHDLEVAHAGDKIYLDVALEPGYVVKGAFNGTDERVPLQRDEGGYYLIVPEGGGVHLSAELERDESAKAMSIADGMAQPVFAYSDVHAEGYTNENSELYRFIVYVETDYDTDRDGACDLVRTYVQVPRAAVEGSYKAPVLFMADPYSAGKRNTMNNFAFANPPVDETALMDGPEHRTPGKSLSTKELALSPTLTHASDWNYSLDQKQFPTGINLLDYYLVRGFAVVQAAGLGTYGSEGIECCGSFMERDAFVDIVEWLHGTPERRAYADAAGTIEVKATDWSSGHVGMTGLSYPGAMCYEVATSGVEGLDTIVPVAAPASWYDFTNSQGICTSTYTSYNYTTMLADTCASRFFSDPDQSALNVYQQYRTHMRDAQYELAGDYGPYWAARDWYTDQTNIRASALIVHGLNDSNVLTKHSDLIRNAFLASGCQVKMLLHQNMHEFPADDGAQTDIMIGDHTYREWLNLWFTRALLGENNEAATLPSFTVQSNVDGSFYSSERWNADDVVTVRPGQEGETTVWAEGAPKSILDPYDNPLTGEANKNAALWTLPVSEQFTIAGKIPVHVRAKVNDVSPGDIPMGAALFDVADEPFGAFAVNGSIESEVVTKGDGSTLNYDVVTWKQGQTTRKLITQGSIDLRNPEAGYEPSSAVKRDEPIEADTYYDYTIWLNPTYYTVVLGHRLELYLVPFVNYLTFANDEARDYVLQNAGFSSTAVMNIRTNYRFTIQNDASYAALPVVEELPDAPTAPTDEGTKTEPTGGADTDGSPAAEVPGAQTGSSVQAPASAVRTTTPVARASTVTRTPGTGDASPSGGLALVAAALVAFAVARGVRRRRVA